ncbi:hypothetical protein ABPG77_000961 [Micractinium sp. CCAP 211/92]
MCACVVIGDEIEEQTSDSVLRGHGTLLRDGALVASRCGIVRRVNQLVLTEPLSGGYIPAVGHVLVGRIVQVESTRWMVEIRSRTLAVLPLSTAGGAVRKAAEGMLNMRSILVEGDLIAAEVQSVRTDGQAQLHVRDAVASKLPQGMLVSLPPTLVRPQRKHMHHCGSSGIKFILGCNGLLWIGMNGSSTVELNHTQAAVRVAALTRSFAQSRHAVLPAVLLAAAAGTIE